MLEETKSVKTKNKFWKSLLLTMISLTIIGCGEKTPLTQTQTEEIRERFSAEQESEDGAIVAWSGYSEGYESGAEAEFDISIKNGTDQTWPGRYCLQLLDRQLPKVIATLEQRNFTLTSGMGFADVLTVQFPMDLSEGAYGLSLAVRRSGRSMVDLVQIQVGKTDEVRDVATQKDLDASLEACPPIEAADGEVDYLVGLAKADLVQRLGVGLDEIEVKSVEATEFPDASLGVPEPGMSYGQVITPGYVIELAVGGEIYVYHGTGDRVVFVYQEGEAPKGSITIEEVQVVSDVQIIVRGHSTLPDGTCLGTELWADGVLQPWWPTDTCVLIQEGRWELSVPLGEGMAPEGLDPTVQYVLRAWLPGGPNIVSVFPFDIAGPPTSVP
jgi:hypothetical protein